MKNNDSTLKQLIEEMVSRELSNNNFLTKKFVGFNITTSPKIILKPFHYNPISVKVEIRDSEKGRNLGLMYKDYLEPEAGMIFVFPFPQKISFWMKNTYIPLDMIFISSDRKVINCEKYCEPLTEEQLHCSSNSNCLYVLEVNAGFCDKNHISEGTLIDFFGIPYLGKR